MYRSGVWVIGVALWCLGDRCLVFDGLGFFFFFLGVDGRLWVTGGSGGVKCVVQQWWVVVGMW